MNIKRSHNLIKELINLGVSEVCLCPGGRNAPLIKALSSFDFLEIYNFVDERSAAFFALGCIKRGKKPVAVITTSGTAVAELLPASIEAYYSYLPLILVTADRPAAFRKAGAPQSIQQMGLFSHYISYSVDLGTQEQLVLEGKENTQLYNRPIHINISFDEPLLAEADENSGDMLRSKFLEKVSVDSGSYADKQLYQDVPSKDPIYFEQEVKTELENISDFFKNQKSPLVILGPLSAFSKNNELTKALVQLNLPIYVEASSQYLGDDKIKSLSIKAGVRVVNKQTFVKHFDSILRIGSVPTLRLWRDLELSLNQVPILSVADNEFSGLARVPEKPVSIDSFLRFFNEWNRNSNFIYNDNFFNQDQIYFKDLTEGIKKYPCSEVSFVAKLVDKIPENSNVFIGNSLPIREWDLVGATPSNKKLKIYSNRGVNGIDGLISTALGCSVSTNDSMECESWCVVGDLSALYDLNALWALQNKKIKNFKLVIINNGGGKIFKPMFKDERFENNHNLQFSGLAKMFSCDYTKIETVDFNFEISNKHIIEIFPNDTETQKFNQELLNYD